MPLPGHGKFPCQVSNGTAQNVGPEGVMEGLNCQFFK